MIGHDLGTFNLEIPYLNPRTIVFPGGLLQSVDDRKFIMAQGTSRLLGIRGTTRQILLDVPVAMVACESEEDLMVVVYQDRR